MDMEKFIGLSGKYAWEVIQEHEYDRQGVEHEPYPGLDELGSCGSRGDASDNEAKPVLVG
jgi:hypothetical protein